MAKFLVIVESPAKSETINKFLGKDFKVVASMGHLVDLPKGNFGVDVKNDFKPNYTVVPARKKTLAMIKKEADDKTKIYLATDPDREGEAICWHISNELKKEKITKRVTFNEITKEAVLGAIDSPREIDMNKVNAQQARRILDRLVGYNLSPLLWKKVSKGLSAGRVQSVALKLIVEREKEISAFIPKEYWSLEALLKKHSGESTEFTATLDKKNGKKIEISKKEEADEIYNEIEKSDFIVEDITKAQKLKKTNPPFTTSKLQQEAFNKLGFSASRTMKIAQQLYEGLEIGEEDRVGLITYMRTDSVRLAEVSQKAAKEYIVQKFGKDYVPKKFNTFKSGKSAQQAHEAIRPALPLREPVSLASFLNKDQLSLYELIWNKFITSQMTDAKVEVTSISIKSGNYLFKASGTTVLFEGFMIVYKEEDRENNLPNLEKNEKLDLIKLDGVQHFTKPPARFSDASLVKILEEKGIGRPSTYAPTIQTLLQRHYVTKQKGYFKPTELGIIVIKLLVEHFPDLISINFTAQMEEELDEIEDGKRKWVDVLKEFYDSFINEFNKASLEMQNVKRQVVYTDEKCSMCGKPMVIKWGRKGRFLSCSAYPECKNAKSITTGIKCPREGCGGELVERFSRRGMFYGCTNFPVCKHTTNKLPEKADEKSDAENNNPTD